MLGEINRRLCFCTEKLSQRYFVEKLFTVRNKNYLEGKGLDEKGIMKKPKNIVKIDSKYFRPTEVDLLIGDATKAKKKLGWTPKITFDELIKEMVNEEMKS